MCFLCLIVESVVSGSSQQLGRGGIVVYTGSVTSWAWILWCGWLGEPAGELKDRLCLCWRGKKKRERGKRQGVCLCLLGGCVCWLARRCMCVGVSFQDGDHGPPSCKLLESSQMVNSDSITGKQHNKWAGRITLYVYRSKNVKAQSV